MPLLLAGCLLPKYRERYVEKDALEGLPQFSAGREKICVVDVEGILMTRPASGGLWGPEESTIERAAKDLRRAALDADVKAAVLRIDSPGGDVTASELLRAEVLRFRAAGKPLVAYYEGLAASGGYYCSAPADRIVCHPTAITGSIGVIAVFPNIEGLMGKIGVEAKTIRSGPMKGSGSPFHRMGADEEKVFQAMIDEMYARFLRVVVDGREPGGRKVFTTDALRPIADGRIYTAEQALANGLVDEIGSLEKAAVSAARLAGLPERPQLKVFRYRKESPGIVVHLARAEGAPPRVPSGDAASLQLSLSAPEVFRRPGFWYLWWPGPE